MGFLILRVRIPPRLNSYINVAGSIDSVIFMEALYFVESSKFQDVENALLKDDLVSRQSFTFRSAANYGLKDGGTLVRISGSDEGLEKAKEIIGDEGKLMKSPEKERILKLMKDEEDSVAQGFGTIFE